jgi:hypothetical protein
LGSYERQAVATALERRGLELEPAPEGKLITRIHVVNLDVFQSDSGFLQHLNVLHSTTREYVIGRELLLRPGDRWRDDLVRESERNLRDPFLSSLAVIVPVKSGMRGSVDLLVVTRDVWSLRTNSEFEIQEGRFTKLTLALAENNFLGTRNHISLIFDMDESEYALGPRYIDTNLAGTRMRLLLWPRLLFKRADDTFEGTQNEARLLYPLWSLASRWGFLLQADHKDNVERVFQNFEVATYDNPDTPEVEAIPQEYRMFEATLRAEATHAVGRSVKHHTTLGSELKSRRPRPLPEFVGSDEDARAFARDLFPRSEFTSALVFRQRVFTPKFRTYRNIETYDLPEDVQIGPDFELELAIGMQPLGSDSGFLRFNAKGKWVFDLRQQTHIDIAAGVSGRYTGSALEDREVSFDLFGATPTIRRFARVIASATMAFQTDVVDNKRFTVGGQTGLRGYDVGEFRGTSFFIGNIEMRTVPRPWWFTRIGAVAFWDVGDAADGTENLSLKNDVGLGLRVLAPQTGESIYRLDWAIPLQGSEAGFPGRLSFGYEQAF